MLSAVLGFLGLLREGLGLLNEVWELLGDALLESVRVGSEILHHARSRSELTFIETYDARLASPLGAETVDLTLKIVKVGLH